MDVVSERGAEAFLGRGNGGGGRYGGGGGEAREYASTESVDLGHGFLMGVEEKKGTKEEKEEENGWIEVEVEEEEDLGLECLS